MKFYCQRMYFYYYACSNSVWHCNKASWLVWNEHKAGRSDKGCSTNAAFSYSSSSSLPGSRMLSWQYWQYINAVKQVHMCMMDVPGSDMKELMQVYVADVQSPVVTYWLARVGPCARKLCIAPVCSVRHPMSPLHRWICKDYIDA